MKLEDIGFYTLCNERAINSSMTSPLCRCELLLTDRCNFKCLYCRGLKNGGDLPLGEAVRILNYWIAEGLRNVRFSGGEPTLYAGLPILVAMAKTSGVQHIAVSTNGSNNIDLYKELIDLGVNDFSISLDACCSSTGDTMAGVKGVWAGVIKNIELLSVLSYVSVGIVLNEENEKEAAETIILAHELGVADIRIIPSAQYNRMAELDIPEDILSAHPILKYRLKGARRIRGLKPDDTRQCRLVLDDMAVWNSQHYPCIIYLREGGKPIGYLNGRTRLDRYEWSIVHDSWDSDICRINCLDVCIEFNNIANRRNDAGQFNSLL